MTAVAELSTTPQDWIAGTWTIDPAQTMAAPGGWLIAAVG
jgi:hypothetical protein